MFTRRFRVSRVVHVSRLDKAVAKQKLFRRALPTTTPRQPFSFNIWYKDGKAFWIIWKFAKLVLNLEITGLSVICCLNQKNSKYHYQNNVDPSLNYF
jgi:hypothetical protein